MQIYLPVAELSINILLLLSLGGGVGILSGLFGVGGGFLMTPLLIFSGISPAIAVATEANQIVASSFSGMLAHWRRKTVDVKMGMVILSGGVVGTTIGVEVFRILRSLGQIDLIISLSYVLFLGIIGSLMLIESINALRKSRRGDAKRRKLHKHTWVHGLPLKMRFQRSKLFISAIPPFLVGVLVGVLAAIMGVGGGFIMVPAMIYLLGMPTNVAVGTSLFQVAAMTSVTTVLHSVQNQAVDVVLALLLLIGGVIGAQIGVRLGAKLRGEQLRGLLALLVLLVCAKIAYDLIATPGDIYNLGFGAAH